jgi:hypothetical protein
MSSTPSMNCACASFARIWRAYDPSTHVGNTHTIVVRRRRPHSHTFYLLPVRSPTHRPWRTWQPICQSWMLLCCSLHPFWHLIWENLVLDEMTKLQHMFSGYENLMTQVTQHAKVKNCWCILLVYTTNTPYNEKVLRIQVRRLLLCSLWNFSTLFFSSTLNTTTKTISSG